MRDVDVAGISSLADPVRRQLYRFVCSQAEPVSRDQAAEAVGVARHQAKFHLDRLEAEGLLQSDYVRLTGRSGPGAGRPAKRYRRGGSELSVTIPPREYDLAGHIMAEAITDNASTGTPIAEALAKAAAAHGRAIAAGSYDPASASDALNRSLRLLADHGYEPRRLGRTVVLTNCPFHSLARTHTELVCNMNKALLADFAESIAPDLFEVRLEPGEDRCCVILAENV
ncbi:MAG TPA: helix-turn-helix domain-containing protein [Pseudonocardiaceae bacterium]|nr:helix-turn-helix domain-containing protein [Pseudonocardiaceae bacterium]